MALPLKFVLHLLLLTALSALAGASWVAHRPVLPVLEDPAKENSRINKDLVDHLKQNAIKGTQVQITEADLNRHLAKVLKARMQPPLASQVTFEHLLVDLTPDLARVTLSWQVAGHRSTARVDLRVTRLAKTFRVEVVSGAYGRLEVPRGLLRPLNPSLTSVSRALREEIQALFQMNQIRVGEDKLFLDPRFP